MSVLGPCQVDAEGSCASGGRKAGAMRFLRAIKDSHAEDRLQIEELEAELAAEPSDDGDRLRLHAASRTATERLAITAALVTMPDFRGPP
jgi:hypothetical protein